MLLSLSLLSLGLAAPKALNNSTKRSTCPSAYGPGKHHITMGIPVRSRNLCHLEVMTR